MPLIRDLQTLTRMVQGTVARRGARARWDRHVASAPRNDRPFEAVIHFADTPVNIYQLRQWYEPMRRLAERHPVAVITGDVESAAFLADECPLPVVLHPTVGETERWLRTQRVGIVFYVNQNALNFRMLRFRDPAHIFISHGESDKDYMASNQLKAYDHTFIAGQAAYDRIGRRLVDFDREWHLVRIGRPQVDVQHPGPDLPDDGRTVVLYAPTWEGDRPTMEYSSLRSHALPMLDALLATGRHRVVYRPHPRTGAFDPSYRALHQSLVTKLESANRADPKAAHVVDADSPFGWHLDAADVCVSDISAVAFDWLATGKPLLLTEPASPTAEVDRDGLAGRLDTFHADRAADVVEELERAAGDDERARYAAIVEHYFGDVTPGTSLGRFLDACEQILSRRARLSGHGPEHGAAG
ncbi:CDP-glycerol glycerophosphotransferase family protein [Isoptericola variabilis]